MIKTPEIMYITSVVIQIGSFLDFCSKSEIKPATNIAGPPTIVEPNMNMFETLAKASKNITSMIQRNNAMLNERLILEFVSVFPTALS